MYKGERDVKSWGCGELLDGLVGESSPDLIHFYGAFFHLQVTNTSCRLLPTPTTVIGDMWPEVMVLFIQLHILIFSWARIQKR